MEPGPVEAFAPVMIFAIVFGLSMDYEVFLLSRMHEEWERTGDASRRRRRGPGHDRPGGDRGSGDHGRGLRGVPARSGRMLKQFGLGLAVAVFLDAVVIRCLVLPAVMQVLGPRAWWLPRWLRGLPRVAIDR